MRAIKAKRKNEQLNGEKIAPEFVCVRLINGECNEEAIVENVMGNEEWDRYSVLKEKRFVEI